MPDVVVAYVGAQVGVNDLRCLQLYAQGDVRWDHAREIREHYGYRDFSNSCEGFLLTRWLYTRVWLTAERPTKLFDLATARLVSRKVLLPGVTVLARLAARIHDRVAERTWRLLAATVTKKQTRHLHGLLETEPGTRHTVLDALRTGPTRISGPALVEALQRLERIRELGLTDVDVSHIPPTRLKSLARYAAATWAQTIARMSKERRTATLVAFRYQLARAYRLAGVKGASVRTLRHTFFTHHAARGTSLVVLKEVGGHRRLTTTQKYLQVVRELMEDQLEGNGL